MKLLLTLISVIYFSQILFAQNPDSLKKILKTSKNDSLKLQALTDLNWIYSNSDFKLSKKYALEEINLAQKIKSQKWLAQGYNDLAISYYKMGQLDSARKENLKTSVRLKQCYLICDFHIKFYSWFFGKEAICYKS